MQFESNSERLLFYPFSVQERFMNNESDLDVSFYQNNVSNVEVSNFLMTEAESSKCILSPSFKH